MNGKPIPQGDGLEPSVTLLGAVSAEAMESQERSPPPPRPHGAKKYQWSVVSAVALCHQLRSSLHILRESPVELKPDATRTEEGSLPSGGLRAHPHTCPSSMVTDLGHHRMAYTIMYQKPLTEQPGLESLLQQTGLG